MMNLDEVKQFCSNYIIPSKLNYHMIILAGDI